MTIGISALDFARAMHAKQQADRGFAGIEGATLAGRGVYGIKQGAVLYVGRAFIQLERLIGHRFPPAKKELGYGLGTFARRVQKGGWIPAERIETLAVKARTEQLGDPKQVAATFVRVRGVYEGGFEPTVQIAFIYTGTEGSFAVFQENMLQLGEALATAFAQKTVLVELQGEDGKPVTHTCSPIGFPSPTAGNFNKFIDRAIEAASNAPAKRPRRK